MSADTVTQPSILEMSDEDVMNMTEPPVVQEAPAGEGQDQNVEEKPADEPGATGSGEGDEEDGEGTGDTTTAQAAEGEGGEDADGGTPAKDDAAKPGDAGTQSPKTDVKDDKAAPEGDKDKPEEAKTVDYKAEYERLLAPFKANGRDVQVGSVDDAINLMQMGANYNKKMAALKPNLKLLKLLENNGLLSEEKISFLIDVDKKVPGAINKLVKESGIDPMEIDADKASTYKQSTYAVDDREIELDTVLEELQGSPTYTRTLDVVSNKWDVASKQVISQAPQLLKVINDHMASGIYDVISTEIERERVFGRLQGVSDIDAYRQVGDAIQARGGFNHLFPNKGTGGAGQAPAKPTIVQPKPKADEAALNDKRRAASPTKPVAPSGAPKDFNPLAMSDEEFDKLAVPKYR